MIEPVVNAAHMKAPFPWFGGKSLAAPLLWRAFGDVRNYVEPFFGSGAVLLARPQPFAGAETVNDLDGFIANAWRAIRADPAGTAQWADWPVNEVDQHARHLWLVERRDGLSERLMADPDFYDAKIAGWWLWGICSWIGSGWCSGNGPWHAIDGKLTDVRNLPHLGNAGRGVKRNRPHLSDAGMGINRNRPHLGNAGMGINRNLPHLGNAGMGINRKRPHLSDAGMGIAEWFEALSERLRRVRVCCGNWSRVTGKSVTEKHGMTAVLLDPPYADSAGRSSNLYRVDSESVAHQVREWALANGHNPKLRIALCGYDGEHAMPKTWTCIPWKARGGYGSQGVGIGRSNAARERIWLSPACLPVGDACATDLLDMDPSA
jgi:hypothetical protein